MLLELTGDGGLLMLRLGLNWFMCLLTVARVQVHLVDWLQVRDPRFLWPVQELK